MEIANGEKYQIIYADPAWKYNVWTAKGGHKSASAHYPVMELKDICELSIKDLADENCVLFMWATYPNLHDAFEVINAWGFVYKTVAFTWVKIYPNGKPVLGLGYWTRANVEICLLATKGNPKRIDKNVSQIILSRQREHSRKPDEARERIVKLMGNLPRIELFARQRYEGWDVWGNESPKEIQKVLR
jgi:N6-adenosine-specific RNA methylase IME4